MSKAEEHAFERCPKSENVIEEMRNEIKRAQFVEGYHQAEKDLALTWENIRDIVRIYLEEGGIDAVFDVEKHCKKVLKQFIETRNKR